MVTQIEDIIKELIAWNMSKTLPKKVSVYSISLRIQSECGEMLTLITPNKDIFDAVIVSKNKITCILE